MYRKNHSAYRVRYYLSFRPPLEIWNMSPEDTEGLLCACVCVRLCVQRTCSRHLHRRLLLRAGTGPVPSTRGVDVCSRSRFVETAAWSFPINRSHFVYSSVVKISVVSTILLLQPLRQENLYTSPVHVFKGFFRCVFRTGTAGLKGIHISRCQVDAHVHCQQYFLQPRVQMCTSVDLPRGLVLSDPSQVCQLGWNCISLSFFMT